MLAPERARERLLSFYVAGWTGQRLADIAGLPGELREIGNGLLGYDAQGRFVDEPTAGAQTRDTALKQLAQLDTADRQRVWAAILPEIAPHVEQAWQLSSRLPYQSGEQRKAFRAPHAPLITQWYRRYWLGRLLEIAAGYPYDITWFAAWTPYLGWPWESILDILLAAAVDAGGEEGDAVFDILVASARGDHEIGVMGRHVLRALLVASRPDGWAFIENLLLAAQRQEGLRQVILETVDEAHPQAFRRMLYLIREHNLARFSATVRAVNVWFGFQFESGDTRAVNQVLEHVQHLLENPAARATAMKGADSQLVYLALWTQAFEDASAAIEPAARLLDDPDVERRFVGVHLLAQLGLVQAQQTLLPALEDRDLRVAARALQSVQSGADKTLVESDLFERLERVLPRFPRRKRILKPIVWPWTTLPAEQRAVADALVQNLGGRPLKRLIPYLPLLDSWGRVQVAEKLVEAKQGDAESRDTLLALVGDRSRYVRERALEGIAQRAIVESEALSLEGLLTRKAGDLRRGVLTLLLNQPDQAALASAERLLAAARPLQRLAGLELLRQMTEADRTPVRCRALARQYRSTHSPVSAAEARLLDTILEQEREVPTLDDALGLLDPAQRTRPTPPRMPEEARLLTPAGAACLESLEDLVHSHRATPVTVETWQGNQEELLGNLQWQFPQPNPNDPLAEDSARLPLRDMWEMWWAQRPAALRDDDGLEVLRALATPSGGLRYSVPLQYREEKAWMREAYETLFGGAQARSLRYPRTVGSILWWLVRLHPPAGAADLLLDGVETTFALIPPEELARVPTRDRYAPEWRDDVMLLSWLRLARIHRDLCPSSWTDAHHVRLWRLLRWMDEPGTSVPRHRPSLTDVLAAFQAGGATEADLLDQLLGPGLPHFTEFAMLTGRKPLPAHERHPALQELAACGRDRIIEVELDRGDMPTAASRPALALRFAGGLDVLVRLLQALGREQFVRGWTYDSLSKPAILSRLIRATFPSESDTPQAFAAQVAAAAVSQQRLIELAIYAPQWAGHVEHTLGWSGFAEVVWWIHAHTKDTNWHVDHEIREAWTAQVSERTPLSGPDLLDGAVDVAWFWRAYEAVGPERWAAIYAQAKYAAGGRGHKRAQLFADAMLGRVEKAELLARITGKRYQDAVRALGLLPLANDLLERYQAIQEFVRTSRKFGSQRQANEKLAARIGMENLARTAGYPDPIRLEWAMEARAIADLAAGPMMVTVDKVTVSLAINDWGEPELTVTKGEKQLKSIPARVRKAPQVAQLRARKRDVEQQTSRVRASLERAMCRGDAFAGAELHELSGHPVLMPMIERLVFVGEGVMGYPAERGQALRSHDGTIQPIDDAALLRIAHPHDLLAAGEWHLWQRECFRRERIQPFKQVFRELYVLTAAERAAGTLSRRYAGHQVQPRQALALLGQRGWVMHPEEGVRHTFHDEGLSAWVTFLSGFFTPAEVEGLTIEGVGFSRRGEWKPLELAQVPPRVFSEVMRDLDLVVSVAHVGRVDPEATASTVEMRAALIRETVAALQLANVRLQGAHALIEGQLGSYSVHLGSAVVHRQPGGAVCIMPVHAQHRGRLFLPFADDDPQTAEVLSKVLLLARDSKIKDPTILEQILIVR